MSSDWLVLNLKMTVLADDICDAALNAQRTWFFYIATQGQGKVFIIGQAKLNPERYSINYVSIW